MTIGYEPEIETLVLVPGQDFLHTIYPPPGQQFADGTSVEIIFYTADGTVITSWDATVTLTSVSWSVDSAVSDTIPTPADFRMFVHYADGTDFCWCRGQVAHQ